LLARECGTYQKNNNGYTSHKFFSKIELRFEIKLYKCDIRELYASIGSQGPPKADSRSTTTRTKKKKLA